MMVNTVDRRLEMEAHKLEDLYEYFAWKFLELWLKFRWQSEVAQPEASLIIAFRGWWCPCNNQARVVTGSLLPVTRITPCSPLIFIVIDGDSVSMRLVRGTLHRWEVG